MLASVLIAVRLLAVLQLAVHVHARNVVTASARDGARRNLSPAKLDDGTPALSVAVAVDQRR